MIVQPRFRWPLLGLLSAALFLIALDNAVLYTALPTLTHTLDASGHQKLWIINAYPLTMSGLLIGAGTLGDRVGHTRLFQAGLGIFGIASLGAAFASSANALIGWRAVLGVGAAVMMPATLALIRLAFPVARERNLAMGIWGAVALVGAASGPVVGGILLEHWWWGAVFLVNVPVTVIALAAMLALRAKNISNPARRWDWISSVYTCVGFGALVLFIKELASPERSAALVVLFAVASSTALLLFTRRQKELEEPLVDLSIFRIPGMRAGVVGAIVVMFSLAGVQLVMSQRLQLVMDYTPLQAGLIVASVAVGALPFALLGGLILHRTGPTILIVGGLLVAAAGVLTTLMMLRSNSSMIASGLMVIGVGVGLVFSAASTVIITSVPSSASGMAASVEEVAYEMGSLLAVAVLGSILAAVFTSSVAVPAGAQGAANSIDDAVRIADANPDLAGEISRSAATAFTTGTQVVLGVILVVLVTGSAIVFRDIRRFEPHPDAADH